MSRVRVVTIINFNSRSYQAAVLTNTKEGGRCTEVAIVNRWPVLVFLVIGENDSKGFVYISLLQFKLTITSKQPLVRG